MTITFGSLFAGIGGLDLGLERAGMQCKWQVEIDDYATKVLEKHWPDIPKYRDIREFPPTEGVEAVDLICGGFPCQDISYAGKGAGLDGERSGLFYELIRVVREVGPRFVLLENVSALLTRGIHDVLGTLASLGYDAEWHCIPAAAVGADHVRDRVFILADTNSSNDFATCNAGYINKRIEHNFYFAKRDIRIVQLARGNRCLRRDSYSRIVREFNGIPHRVDRLRGLGNAVVPQVAEFIGRAIMEAIQ